MKEAVIVAAARTAVGKAPRGTLRTTRPDDMAAAVITDLLKRLPSVPPESIDDVIGEMRRRKSRYGMVTMCVGGGQGAATLFQNLQN